MWGVSTGRQTENLKIEKTQIVTHNAVNKNNRDKKSRKGNSEMAEVYLNKPKNGKKNPFYFDDQEIKFDTLEATVSNIIKSKSTINSDIAPIIDNINTEDYLKGIAKIKKPMRKNKFTNDANLIKNASVEYKKK